MSKKTEVASNKSNISNNFRVEFVDIPGIKDCSVLSDLVVSANIPMVSRGKSNTNVYEEFQVVFKELGDFHIESFFNWMSNSPSDTASAKMILYDKKENPIKTIEFGGLEISSLSSWRMPRDTTYSMGQEPNCEFFVTMRVGSLKWV